MVASQLAYFFYSVVNNVRPFHAGSIWFASEMKAISDDCERFMSFLPGHIYSSKLGMHMINYRAMIYF